MWTSRLPCSQPSWCRCNHCRSPLAKDGFSDWNTESFECAARWLSWAGNVVSCRGKCRTESYWWFKHKDHYFPADFTISQFCECWLVTLIAMYRPLKTECSWQMVNVICVHCSRFQLVVYATRIIIHKCNEPHLSVVAVVCDYFTSTFLGRVFMIGYYASLIIIYDSERQAEENGTWGWLME